MNIAKSFTDKFLPPITKDLDSIAIPSLTSQFYRCSSNINTSSNIQKRGSIAQHPYFLQLIGVTQMRRAYASAVYPVKEKSGNFVDVKKSALFNDVKVSAYDRFSFQKHVFSNPFCVTEDCKTGAPKMIFVEWFLSHKFGQSVDMEGNLFT